MLIMTFEEIAYKNSPIQDIETGCPILAIVKFLRKNIFKENQNIFRYQL